ncbi:hypothetical protein MTYM_01039 [Methylococcales bacterium]|nr:hypothetical protein MTYM_01039 [Methylococcales bacterium]
MARVEFNKLIRDRVKEKIEAKGDTCEVEVLSDEAFEDALRLKLIEEATELAAAKERSVFLSEYADLMVVLDALASRYDLSEADLKLTLIESLEKKGGFEKRHFLRWSEYKNKS